MVSIEPRKKWLSRILAERGIILPDDPCDIEEVIEEDIEDDEPEVDEEEYLKSLDPRNWKEQDHYAVLGLRKKRYKASEDDIRRACK